MESLQLDPTTSAELLQSHADSDAESMPGSSRAAQQQQFAMARTLSADHATLMQRQVFAAKAEATTVCAQLAMVEAQFKQVCLTDQSALPTEWAGPLSGFKFVKPCIANPVAYTCWCTRQIAAAHLSTHTVMQYAVRVCDIPMCVCSWLRALLSNCSSHRGTLMAADQTAPLLFSDEVEAQCIKLSCGRAE